MTAVRSVLPVTKRLASALTASEVMPAVCPPKRCMVFLTGTEMSSRPSMVESAPVLPGYRVSSFFMPSRPEKRRQLLLQRPVPLLIPVEFGR